MSVLKSFALWTFWLTVVGVAGWLVLTGRVQHAFDWLTYGIY